MQKLSKYNMPLAGVYTWTSHCVVGGTLMRSHLHAKVVGSTT